MDPKKLKGVADWPTPRNPTEIRQFLGFTGYYRYFVPNYSRIARPLLDLTKKATPWHWGKPQQEAFEDVTICLLTHFILASGLSSTLYD